MRKITFWGTIFFMLTLISCEKNINNNTDEKSDVIIQNDGLDDRIKTDSAGVVSSLPVAGLKSTAVDDEMASDLPLVLVAEVTPPKYKGKTLRATHVALSNNYAFVSYNYEGEEYLGGVDMINVSNPDDPKLIGSAILPEIDLSSIVYSSTTVIAAGAKSDFREDGSNPACVIRINLANNLLSEDAQIIDLPGYVGTDLTVDSEKFYVVSGDNGVVASYNLSDNSKNDSIWVSDLRAVGLNDDQLVVLSGVEGLYIYNPVDLSELSSISTSSDVAGKRTIDFYNGHVLAAEGYNGIGVYNIASGDHVSTIPLADASGLDVEPNDVVCNAVSVNNEHVFVANGAAGVSVLSINEGAIDDLDDFGSLDLPGSANYVMSKGEYVFVADGTGGLQILKMVTVDEETEISCADYPEYDGKKNLTVNSGEDLGYSGSASLDKIEVTSASSLFWCGSLAASQHIIINSGGEFYMRGSLAQGSKNQNFIINAGGVLKVEGSLVIYGDLILNSESTIEFIGDDSSITVHGSVTKGDDVTITGTFTDTNNSLSD
ncbi:hypothetical protein ACUNWD_06020 [Sunxiuqinia sp. A32]|uniref:hypothetical protein n=1 Tax=Sunxiuqinia sp. A32 TaxID=3461496 RepID=UPI0040459345